MVVYVPVRFTKDRVNSWNCCEGAIPLYIRLRMCLLSSMDDIRRTTYYSRLHTMLFFPLRCFLRINLRYWGSNLSTSLLTGTARWQASKEPLASVNMPTFLHSDMAWSCYDTCGVFFKTNATPAPRPGDGQIFRVSASRDIPSLVVSVEIERSRKKRCSASM